MRKGWLLVVVLVAVIGRSSVAETTPQPRRLQVLGRYTLPAGISPMDLRWAGKDSVFLVDAYEGVSERRLAPGLPTVRRVTPRARDIGFVGFVHLAASPEWLLFSHAGVAFGWQPRDANGMSTRPKRKEKSGHYQDFDVRGDEVVLLGFPDLKTYKEMYTSSGRAGVIWRSHLSDNLASWEMVHSSDTVARQGGRFDNLLFLGSIRYLRDGRFVVAPNFEPGVLLFSASGSLKKTWTAEELWGEAQTDALSAAAARQLKSVGASRHLIEEVLPLPEGPAIVVRQASDEGTRWRLGVLGAEIEWYDIPVSGVDRIARLRGDVDERGRIALVGAQREFYAEAKLATSEVILLGLPED